MIGVLTVFILLIGWRFLGGIFDDTCQLQEKEFLDQLDEALTNFVAYGSVKTLHIPPPCNVEKFCFVDARIYGAEGNPWQSTYTFRDDHLMSCRGGGTIGTIGPYDMSQAFLDGSSPGPNPQNQRIKNSIVSPTSPPTNLFFIDKDGGTVPVEYYADTVQLEEFCSVLCIEDQGGLFRFRLHGLGKHVIVTGVS